MKAAYVEQYGKNQKLKIGDLPQPRAGSGQVLIQIHAASVNPIDFKVRNGLVRFVKSFSFPLILGHDGAGVVESVGERVQKFKAGDEVYFRPRTIGTFAEYISVDENEVALKPSNISFAEAASLPLVALTALQGLQDVAGLKAGQKVLIHAGSGGVGTIAIQLAKLLGAEVWTTTSGKNEAFVKSLGADHVINYQKENFAELGPQMDVVFDALGGRALKQSFKVVKPGGWVVSIAGAPDQHTARGLGLGFLKTLVLGAVGLKANLQARSVGAQYRFIFMRPSGTQLSEIASWVESGKIKPVVDKIFPLAQAQSAVEYSEQGHARGKIIVQIQE